LVVAAVEVAAVRDARLLRGFGEGVEDVPAQPLLLDAPLAARTLALRVEPGRGVEGVGTLVEVLVLEEVRQALVPAPAGVGAEADPVVRRGGLGVGGALHCASPGNSLTRPSDITSTARAASRMPMSRVMTLMPVLPSTRAIRPDRLNASQTDRPMTTP